MVEVIMNRFFIIGNPRSGTTLLRLMLNKHSLISVPPEAGFLVWLYYNGYDEFTFNENEVMKFIKSLQETKKIESWKIDFTALTHYILSHQPVTYTDLCDLVYQYYIEYNLGKKVTWVGDKNNFYLKEIDGLSTLYPDAKFIHIIRDGRSVAVSYQDLNKKKMASDHAPVLPVDVKVIAEDWKNNISCITKSFDKLSDDRKITIRFEDLVLNPESVLSSISQFLGVEYESAMLAYYRTTEQEGLEPSSYLDWKEKNLKPLQKDEVLKYKKLSDEDRGSFEASAYYLLKDYGYL